MPWPKKLRKISCSFQRMHKQILSKIRHERLQNTQLKVFWGWLYSLMFRPLKIHLPVSKSIQLSFFFLFFFILWIEKFWILPECVRYYLLYKSTLKRKKFPKCQIVSLLQVFPSNKIFENEVVVFINWKFLYLLWLAWNSKLLDYNATWCLFLVQNWAESPTNHLFHATLKIVILCVREGAWGREGYEFRLFDNILKIWLWALKWKQGCQIVWKDILMPNLAR